MAKYGESELIDNFIVELQPYLALIAQGVEELARTAPDTRIVDQATLPLCALLALAVAIVAPLPKPVFRLLVFLATFGFLAPLVGLVVPVASTYAFAEPTTVALKVTDKYHSDGRGGHCHGFRFESRPDLMVHRVCVSPDVWNSAEKGDQLAAEGVRNGLGLRVLNWGKLGK